MRQIKLAAESELYQLSLFAVLSLPDICGAMTTDDGKTSGVIYRTWFNKYVENKYGGRLTASDCYRFRCSLLHQGSTMHEESQFTRYIFAEPSSITLHKNIFESRLEDGTVEKVLNLDVRQFCADMIEGAQTWLNEVRDTDNFKKNYTNFMKRYPNGFAPYIVGVPVIT